jgi:phosphoribosylpyrophosphate synthetase/non-canonical (house-cleaning) NTP pyrophosphatase
MCSPVYSSILSNIKIIPDYPQKGLYYRDPMGLFTNTKLRDLTIKMLVQISNISQEETIMDNYDYIVGLGSKGSIIALGISHYLSVNFYSIDTELSEVSELEELKDKRILLVSDVLFDGVIETKITELFKKINGKLKGFLCICELLNHSIENIQIEKLKTETKVYSLFKFSLINPTNYVNPDDLYLLEKPIQYTSTDNFLLDNLIEEDKRIVVFSHPSMRTIGDNIVQTSSLFRNGSIMWNHFPDGYPNIRFEHLQFLENKHVVFIGSLLNPKDLLEQLSMIMVLPKQFIKSLDIIFPYFAPGTMERVDEEGILATAETMAKILACCLPVTKKGLPILHIYDLHALPVRFYFPDTVIVRMESAIPLLKQKISKNTTIAFPDEGASKRFKSMFSDYRTIVCSKVREGNTRNIKIIDKWNFPLDDSKCLDDVLIVDDLVQSGGTLEECRKALESMGAKKISAYVTHAVFPNKSWEKFLNCKFDKFYITNSIPEIANILEHKKPFEVIKLDSHIKNTLLRSYDIKIPEIANINNFVIYVGSTNEQKLKATHDTFRKILDETFNCHLNNIKVYGINVPSNVSEQPINDETKIGCINRTDNLEKYLDHYNLKCDFIVGIENGINVDLIEKLTEESIVYDFCYINIISLINNRKINLMTKSLDKTFFPAKYLMESIKNNCKLTAGSLIEKDLGVKSGSWHKIFGNTSRIEMMSNCIRKTLEAMFNTNSTKKTIIETELFF